MKSESPILFLNGYSHIQICLKYLKIILNIKHFRKIIINSTIMIEIFHKRFHVVNCLEEMINYIIFRKNKCLYPRRSLPNIQKILSFRHHSCRIN